MSDIFPPLHDERKIAILAALAEESGESPYNDGDVSVKDIVRAFGVSRFKAREWMKLVVARYPEQFREVQVRNPDSYHNRPIYVIRAVGSSPSAVPITALDLRRIVAGSKP